MSSFWDTFDDRPIDVKPGHERGQRRAPTTQSRDVPSTPRCAQNDLRGMCGRCGVESDDVMFGRCAGCA